MCRSPTQTVEDKAEAPVKDPKTTLQTNRILFKKKKLHQEFSRNIYLLVQQKSKKHKVLYFDLISNWKKKVKSVLSAMIWINMEASQTDLRCFHVDFEELLAPPLPLSTAAAGVSEPSVRCRPSTSECTAPCSGCHITLAGWRGRHRAHTWGLSAGEKDVYITCERCLVWTSFNTEQLRSYF